MQLIFANSVLKSPVTSPLRYWNTELLRQLDEKMFGTDRSAKKEETADIVVRDNVEENVQVPDEAPNKRVKYNVEENVQEHWQTQQSDADINGKIFI